MTRVAHLAARFARSLAAAPPSDADDAWAAAALTPAERALFARQSHGDRRHAIDGARAVAATVPDDVRGDAVEATLVHDVGKWHAGLGVFGRSVATVVGWGLRDDASRASWTTAGGWRGRVGSYLRHDAVGAAEVAAAGGSVLAVAWTADHHHPERFGALPTSAVVAAALDHADRHF